MCGTGFNWNMVGFQTGCLEGWFGTGTGTVVLKCKVKTRDVPYRIQLLPNIRNLNQPDIRQRSGSPAMQSGTSYSVNLRKSKNLITKPYRVRVAGCQGRSPVCPRWLTIFLMLQYLKMFFKFANSQKNLSQIAKKCHFRNIYNKKCQYSFFKKKILLSNETLEWFILYTL